MYPLLSRPCRQIQRTSRFLIPSGSSPVFPSKGLWSRSRASGAVFVPSVFRPSLAGSYFPAIRRKLTSRNACALAYLPYFPTPYYIGGLGEVWEVIKADALLVSRLGSMGSMGSMGSKGAGACHIGSLSVFAW